MSHHIESVDLHDVWKSGITDFLRHLLLSNWAKIGITAEIEARLGKMDEDGFVSGVSVETFYQMRDYLMQKTYWTDRDGRPARPKEVDEYAIVFESGARVVMRKNGGDFEPVEVIQKRSKEKRTYFFGDHIYCLRISMAEETPLSDQSRNAFIKSARDYLQGKPVQSSSRVLLVRHRQRTSFNYYNEYTLDMTATQSGESLAEVESDQTVFEVECEMGIPRHSLNKQLFIFLNAILARMLGQRENVTMPPPDSIFHPKVADWATYQSTQPCPLSCDIELLNNEGYDDMLIQWCKQQHPEGRAILPLALAQQIRWSYAHPQSMWTLQDSVWYPFDQNNLRREEALGSSLRVVNNGGVIRTPDGQTFHCCIWQYEGVLLKQAGGVKRTAQEISSV